MTKKINWLITWLSFNLLKRSLAYHINGKASEKWIQQPKGPVNIFNRVDFILAYCRNKNVLHVGCTDYPFTKHKLENNSLLHQNLKKICTKISGIDNNKKSIDEYIQLTGDSDVYYCDIMQEYPAEIISESFEVILLSEVLEHLKNPAEAIEILHDNFISGTKILVTVPNYTSAASIAASLNKTEAIHPDHYWYFSPYTLCKLFNNEKFEMEQLNFGMYYQQDKKMNIVMKKYPFNADCIIAIFSIKK